MLLRPSGSQAVFQTHLFLRQASNTYSSIDLCDVMMFEMDEIEKKTHQLKKKNCEINEKWDTVRVQGCPNIDQLV